MRRLTKAIVLLVLFGMFVSFMPKDGFAMSDVSNTSYGSESFTPENQSIDTTAGNIYEYNLTTIEKTYRWVGLWGNITGTVELRTTTDTFYTWTVSPVTTGSILYATTDPTGIDPTNFDFTNGTYLAQADSAYGYSTSVTDSISNTYTGVEDFDSPSRDTNVTANTTAVGSWTNYFLRPTTVDPISSTDDTLWAVKVEQGQTAFNNDLADYQIMVPENEEADDGEDTVTTYYLWLEMN